jgi:signal transduction histidine kinase/ligand-binding sensor domain-containing protein/DNA-binding NarL/FixJ family response regulator
MATRLKIELLLVFLIFFILNGKAEFDCFFEHFSTEDGLSHGSVSSMLKDKKGFMWFATWDGINRFDGHTFKTYKIGNEDNSNFSSNRIETMVEDHYGNIWVINYDASLFRLNHQTENFEPVNIGSNPGDKTQIISIFPSSNGDVWAATRNSGAIRIMADPVTMEMTIEQYTTDGKYSLPGNDILFIQEDRQNHIWISTNKGMVCFQPENKTHSLIQKNFDTLELLQTTSSQIISFYASSNEVFFGSSSGEFFRFQKGKETLERIDLDNTVPVTFITGNGKGMVCMGTSGNGIFEYDESLKKITAHYFHPWVDKVLKIFIDSYNLIWAETSHPGYSLIDPINQRYYHFEQQLDITKELRASAQCGLVEDKNHVVWLTLRGGGFGYYNRATGTIEYFYNKPGDPQSKISNYVYSFYKDSSDVLWLSTYFKGIEKVTFLQDRFKLVQLSPQSNLTIANEVRSVMEDSEGLLWVATKKQELFLLDHQFNVVKKIDQLEGQKIGMVYTMFEDTKGNIYLGTKGNGMFVLLRNHVAGFNVNHFTNDPDNPFSISGNNIYSIIEDRKKHLWIGTYDGGLNRYENGHFFHYKSLNYPKEYGRKIRQVVEDKKGNIWLATTDGLIFSGNSTSSGGPMFTLYSREKGNVEGLKGTDVYWIYCDKNDSLWVATLGGGLAHLENLPDNGESLKFKVYTKNDGLPSDVIFTIMGDGNGNLLMSTENGISFYDTKLHSFRNYSRYDGIINSGFSEGAAFASKDGTIFFGANNGLYCFHPGDLKNEQKKVNLVFTGLQLFNKEVIPGKGSPLKTSIAETKAIRLKYNQNVIRLTWAGLDYGIQDKIRYAYQLKGYDADWHSIQERGIASYSKLPPGNYTFTVKFDNPELQQLNSPISVEIQILPPPWKTTWAYIIYLLLVIVMVEITRRIATTMIRLRNKVIIEKELTDIKLNFFTNISHELRTPLTLILGPVNELKNRENLTEKGKTYTLLIEQNARRLLRLVNQLLDFRKVQQGSMKLSLSKVNLVEFVKVACSYFDVIAKEKRINYTVQSQSSSIMAMIDEEKMDSVIFNLLSNAFKFTPVNGTVSVIIENNPPDDRVVIKVQDSGIGINKEDESSLFKTFASHYDARQIKMAGTGIGLSLSKELIKLHGGEIIYNPTPGGGATFSVVLKSLHLSTDEIAKVQLNPDFENTITGLELTGNFGEKLSDKRTLPSILIVEDNHEMIGFLRLQLEEMFVVHEADNGLDGWNKALELQPDIILSDVMMPGMDGIELLDHVKRNFDTSHIPVVLLTARSSVESNIEGLKYGADAYLTKPFNSDQLKAQLDNLLNQRVLLREHYLQKSETSDHHLRFTVTDKDAGFLERVCSIVEENLANVDFKVEDIYKNIGMGRSKFFDKLKGLTGQSPVDFIREFRLKKALDLLQSGNYNISEASYLSGFTDPGYFSKCFKEKYGVSPSHYGKDN